MSELFVEKLETLFPHSDFLPAVHFEIFDEEIENLKQLQSQAVESQNYRAACQFRDQAEAIRKLKEKIIVKMLRSSKD